MASAVKQNLAGPLSFGIGIIVAIAGATKLPADGTKWPDTWPVFLIGALLSVAGIVLGVWLKRNKMLRPRQKMEIRPS